MNKKALILILWIFFYLGWTLNLQGGTLDEKFKIEGLISPASPKALTEGLEKKLDLKVIGIVLTDTSSGWPELTVRYDSSSFSREKIEELISEIEDPAGHKYQVHKGPLQANAPLTGDEMQAIAILGPVPEAFPEMKNPMGEDSESASRGEKLYIQNCAKCHGQSGNGYGPVSHGFTTWPRQLWAWNNAGSETDGYLFWFITNGRSDMPPWGIVLSENERWDLVSYIKTLKPKPSE